MLAIAAIILINGMVISCTSNQSAIVGKWQSVDKTVTYEFFKDGTVTREIAGSNLDGTYRFMTELRIYIELKVGSGLRLTTEQKIAIWGDEMTLGDEKSAVKYRRIAQ